MPKLSRSSGSAVKDPSAGQIATALQEIVGAGEDFAVLDSEQGFIQAAEGTSGGLVLEYKLSGSNTLHRVTGRSVSVQEAAEAFERFRRGDMSWTSAYQWETEELAGRGSGAGCLSVFIMLAFMAVAAWAP